MLAEWRFSAADRERTNVHGSGLGLPIVQEIAAQHRAEVSVDDAHPGQQPPGACFTVRFRAS